MNSVSYLLGIAKEVAEGNADYILNRTGVEQKLRTLDSELAKLSPNDFLPSVQGEFAIVRQSLHDLVPQKSWFPEQPKALARRLVTVLENYGGEGSGKTLRSFGFIQDTALRAIIERDYLELTTQAYPAHAKKSTVILAGSILEAILFDRLILDPAMKTRAVASSGAPKDRLGNVLNTKDWTLQHLIQVAADLGVLPAAKEKLIDQSLRDYRNFVHPRKEVRSQISIGDPEMRSAVAALDGVCDFLASRP
jgi:hypothetical protein